MIVECSERGVGYCTIHFWQLWCQTWQDKLVYRHVVN